MVIIGGWNLPHPTRPTVHHDEREDHDGHEEDVSGALFANFVSFGIFVVVS
jgi:hypothetical protein